jgi:membrane fusion protein, multidrug efflux system
MNVSMKQALNRSFLLILAGLAGFAGCKKQDDASAKKDMNVPIPVEVVTVHLDTPAWTQTYPGKVEGIRRAEVRPRVSGILVKRSYKEGSFVKEGDELFKIDPEPYEIAVELAQAQYDRAVALEAQARRDFERIDKLFQSGAVSDKQHDDSISTYELAKAGTKGAGAALKQAKLNLKYTSVTAPVGGVTDMEVLTEGSLVSSADKLTVVTQLDPVYVTFSLPEGDPAFQLLFAKGSRSEEGSTAMTLITKSGKEYGTPGRINFSETGVDPSTGAVGMRAEFPNPDHILLPGQFARIVFRNLKLNPSAIIPADAVLMTAKAPIVYVVNGQNAVEPRPVALGPVLEAGQLVTWGLNDGDRVIVTSLIRIRPGMPVMPKERGQVAPAASQDPAQTAPQGAATESAK